MKTINEADRKEYRGAKDVRHVHDDYDYTDVAPMPTARELAQAEREFMRGARARRRGWRDE